MYINVNNFLIYLCCRFMLTPIPNIKSTLDMKVKAADAKIKTIEVCIYMLYLIRSLDKSA